MTVERRGEPPAFPDASSGFLAGFDPGLRPEAGAEEVRQYTQADGHQRKTEVNVSQGACEGREAAEASARARSLMMETSPYWSGEVHAGWSRGNQPAQRADAEAFGKLVREYSGLVYRVAFRLLGPDDAQDAAQEVWVRVWRKTGGFRGESAFSTWLHRIAFNTCLSARNRRARRASLEIASVSESLSDLPGSGDDPKTEAVRGEWAEELSGALPCIRVEHRDAVVLRHVRGLSYAEISGVLGVPRNTARGWASRGRAELLVVLAGGEKRREGAWTGGKRGHGVKALLDSGAEAGTDSQAEHYVGRRKS